MLAQFVGKEVEQTRPGGRKRNLSYKDEYLIFSLYHHHGYGHKHIEATMLIGASHAPLALVIASQSFQSNIRRKRGPL